NGARRGAGCPASPRPRRPPWQRHGRPASLAGPGGAATMRQAMRASGTASRGSPGDDRPIAYDELPTYVGYQVRRAQATVFAEFGAGLGGLDFTPGTFGVLTLIRANPGITQVALAAAFGIDKSTLSPVIVRLEKRGLIRRQVLASDRRRHALSLVPAAEAD